MAYKIHKTSGNMVRLDVGGKVYTTSVTTLTKYSESMLGAMFSGRVPVQTDDSGTFRIDRDGKLFRHVLNFLRSSKLHLPENFQEYDQLLDEADFYQIDALTEAVSEMRQQRQSDERLGEPAQYIEFNFLSSNGYYELRGPKNFRMDRITDMEVPGSACD
ncbi:BTB/POZ domain-containing protein KCTD21-like [Ptychodera flava]|uniref:BTB/POZ domain-containing protein KCTD21-like n=1 Tax=Ptychodera flava TaxID=63121 RepID=UPI003969E03F